MEKRTKTGILPVLPEKRKACEHYLCSNAHRQRASERLRVKERVGVCVRERERNRAKIHRLNRPLHRSVNSYQWEAVGPQQLCDLFMTDHLATESNQISRLIRHYHPRRNMKMLAVTFRLIVFVIEILYAHRAKWQMLEGVSVPWPRDGLPYLWAGIHIVNRARAFQYCVYASVCWYMLVYVRVSVCVCISISSRNNATRRTRVRANAAD